MIKMGFGRKLLISLFVFLILAGTVFYLAYTFDNSFTCGLVNQYAPWISGYIGCGIIPFSLGGSSNINGTNLQIQYVNQYRLNWSVPYIIKTQPGIKTWRSFANYTTNQEAQLQAFNIFSYGYGDNVVYYDKYGIYIPYNITIVDTYYNNGTFSNYEPSLIGKIVNVTGVVTAVNLGIGHYEPPPRYYNVQYKITNMTLSNKGIVRWFLTEAVVTNPHFINISNETMQEANNTVSLIYGIYYNGTEIVLPNS
jgi:hypothetical protein